MHFKIRKNFKKLYDINEVRYRPQFCICKRLGDYLFVFETAYVKEKFIANWPVLHKNEWSKMKKGEAYDLGDMKGHWYFLAAMPRNEAFVEKI